MLVGENLHYFTDRQDAGRQLTDKIFGLGTDNVTVIALSRGAILVAEEIAKKVHGSIFIFATDEALGDKSGPGSAIFSGEAFSYNTAYPLGEIEEDESALRYLTDARHMSEYQKLNHIVGKDGLIPHALLNRHNIILVSDGLKNALSLQIAAEFLRRINVKKIILTTPVASVEAIDKMHILVDQIFCLSSLENYTDTNHYYQKNEIPDDLTVVKIMQNIVLNWPIPEPN